MIDQKSYEGVLEECQKYQSKFKSKSKNFGLKLNEWADKGSKDMEKIETLKLLTAGYKELEEAFGILIVAHKEMEGHYDD